VAPHAAESLTVAGFFQFLHSQPFFVIFGVVALGMWLGAKKIGGSRSAVPGIGYPIPLAITTVALSVVAYFFALFA
jgi:hypothetical protein